MQLSGRMQRFAECRYFPTGPAPSVTKRLLGVLSSGQGCPVERTAPADVVIASSAGLAADCVRAPFDLVEAAAEPLIRLLQCFHPPIERLDGCERYTICIDLQDGARAHDDTIMTEAGSCHRRACECATGCAKPDNRARAAPLGRG